MARETETRQVFDLPKTLIEVTEHRRFIYACAGCGGRTGAAFPDGVEAPAQYGERLRAAALSLHLQQLIQRRGRLRRSPTSSASPPSVLRA